MPSRTQTGLEILIIGASVCGLTTALALACKGHHVRVIEDEKTLNQNGSCITLLPNATRLLFSWGLKNELEKYGTPIRCFASRDGTTGELIGHTPCNIGSTSKISYGAEYWTISRADYLIMIGTATEKYDMKIIFDVKLEEIDIENVRAVGEDGHTFLADLIIGADGIGSRVRTCIPGLSEVKINEWPEHCYWCHVPKERMYGNPLLESLLDPSKIDGSSYMHDGKYILTWPMRPETPFEIIAGISQKAPDMASGKWGHHVSADEVRLNFCDFCPEIEEALRNIEEGTVTKWNVGELPVLKTWRSPNGRIVLAGDAAHGMIPHAASGSSSAIEDAAVLAETVSWAFEHGKSVSEATSAYEFIRKPRVTRLQEISRERYGFLTLDAEMSQGRNTMLREMDRRMWETLNIPEEDRRKMPKPESDMRAPYPAQWLYGYDAIQEAKSHLAKLSQICE